VTFVTRRTVTSLSRVYTRISDKTVYGTGLVTFLGRRYD
jgi:hypothetical protein